MVTKIKNYIGFFAAAFNIVASTLYFIALRHAPMSGEVSSAIATWFFGSTLLLWIVFLILRFSSRQSTK